MSAKKTVVITPVLLPPDPADFDELCPFAREVMDAIDAQYVKLINTCSNNGYGNRQSELDVMRLSPIPCLEDCNDIGITIDTGSRRNRKLIEQSNKNLEQILGKTRGDIAESSGIGIDVDSDEPDAAKPRKTRVSFRDFAFAPKKRKVLAKCGNARMTTREDDVTVASEEPAELTFFAEENDALADLTFCAEESDALAELTFCAKENDALAELTFFGEENDALADLTFCAKENDASAELTFWAKENDASADQTFYAEKNDASADLTFCAEKKAASTEITLSPQPSDVTFLPKETDRSVETKEPNSPPAKHGALAQFAFKPRVTPVGSEREREDASGVASSDASSDMSFSQASAGHEPLEHMVISETPASKILAPEIPFEKSTKASGAGTSYSPSSGKAIRDPAPSKEKLALDCSTYADFLKTPGPGTNEQALSKNGGRPCTGQSALDLLSQLYAVSDGSEQSEGCQSTTDNRGNPGEPKRTVAAEAVGLDTVQRKMAGCEISPKSHAHSQAGYLPGQGLWPGNSDTRNSPKNGASLNTHSFRAKGGLAAKTTRDGMPQPISHWDSFVRNRKLANADCASTNGNNAGEEDIVHRSVSENKFTHDTGLMNEQSEQIRVSQSFVGNKVEYVANWLNQLPNTTAKGKTCVQCDEQMDSPTKMDAANESNKNTLDNSWFNAADRTHPNQNEAEQKPGEKDYVEDWFKAMPGEYLKIKHLFDFDTSKEPVAQAPCASPFLPPKPVAKAGKTKTVQRKTYVLEIDRSTARSELKKPVQTKITSMLRPVARPTFPANVKPKGTVADARPQKRKITDHFRADKKSKLDGEESCPGPRFVKRKHKYFTPVLSQVAEKEVQYEVYSVDEQMAGQMETYLGQNVPHEVCFNMLYSEGFCQLSQPKTSSTVALHPTGLMLSVSWLTQKHTERCFTEFYHVNLSKAFWRDFRVVRSLVNTCLTLHCRKVCFKAQHLFVFLMDTLAFSPAEVSLTWLVLDPFVGCWLLDPDLPPTTFQGVQSQLGTRPRYRAATDDVLLRACDLVLQLAETTVQLQRRLEERDLWTIFAEMETKIASILAGMQHQGIATDVAMLRGFSSTLQAQAETVERKAHQVVGRQFQLSSPLQVRRILYDELRLDSAHSIGIRETAGSGVKSTAEPMLQLLRAVHPLPGLVLEHRHLQKARSTFVDSMLQHVRDGVIRCTWEQTAAATGRIACSQPNMQAIPKHPFPLLLFPDPGAVSETRTLALRNAFHSQPGYSLVAADFQHIELRVFAHLSRDTTIADALKAPGDIFVNLTRSWLGSQVQTVSPEQRERTKKIVYATIYGAGPGKLADILSVPVEEATGILRDFSRKFPSLREFSANTVEQCRIQGYLTSLSGRCRLFPNINSPTFGLKAQSERQAVNFLVQGSAADLCKAAMICTEEKLKGLRCRLLLQIHDELVWEVLDSDLGQVTAIVRQVMEDTSTMCGRLVKLSVPLPVSVSVGKRWGDMR